MAGAVGPHLYVAHPAGDKLAHSKAARVYNRQMIPERRAFLDAMAELLDLPSGTLNGTEALDQLENWNSLAVISVIALADERCGVVLQNKELVLCKTVNDVLRLAGLPE